MEQRKSAFERHPLRSVYEATARQLPPKNALEILQATMRKVAGEKVNIPAARHLSPQNRRVRFAADLQLASSIEFPNHVTRQQSRAQARRERP